MAPTHGLKKVAAAGLLLVGVTAGGIGSAYAGWSATSPDGGSAASVSTDRSEFSVRDATGDNNRAYGDYWRNNSSSQYQLITKQYGEVVKVTLSGSTKVSAFRACNDHPIAGDNCSKKKYL